MLAKQIATIDQLSNGRFILGTAAGWYKREFDAVGVPFAGRGKIMDQNLEIVKRLLEEDMVSGDYEPHQLRNAVMFPKSVITSYSIHYTKLYDTVEMLGGDVVERHRLGRH